MEKHTQRADGAVNASVVFMGEEGRLPTKRWWIICFVVRLSMALKAQVKRSIHDMIFNSYFKKRYIYIYIHVNDLLAYMYKFIMVVCFFFFGCVYDLILFFEKHIYILTAAFRAFINKIL